MNRLPKIFSNQLETKRFGALDGLRGIAVLIVFMSHTSGRDMSLHKLLQFHGIGHVGVYLFFCLSAYLLVGKILNTELKANDIKKFFIKRIFRIWPLYFTVITIVFLIQQFTGEVNEQYLHISNGFTGFILHLLFYQGDSVFWSVVVEEQFYVICPIVAIGLKKYFKVVILLLVIFILINFGLYISYFLGVPKETDYIKYITTNNRGLGNYFDIFFFCSILTFFSIRYNAFIEKYKKIFFVISNILFIAILVFTLILVSHNFLGFSQPFYKFRYLSLLYAICFMPFIISVNYGNPINILLDFYILRKIGLFGFSIYLLHFFVFQFINNEIVIGSTYKFLIAAILTYTISYISYYIIEKKFINLSYKLIKKYF